jgi:hypothetical protein
MEKKQIEVDCPCCATKLTIDVLTSSVVRSTAPAELDETGRPKRDEGRWDRAEGRVAERSAGAQDKLESALDSERTKEARFDDLFEKARKKVEERGEGPGPLG